MQALISCHTVIIRVFTNLTPFIPLSFKGEGVRGWVANQSLIMALIPKLVPLSGMRLNALERKYVVCPEFQDDFAAKS